MTVVDMPSIATCIIFLDIDGVICCNNMGRLEMDKLHRLRHIVDATGAEVVLSTDWRRSPQLKLRLLSAFKQLGISYAGSTPELPEYRQARPREILRWLRENDPGGKIGHWVAIDDRDLLDEEAGGALKGRFVQTTFSEGLTQQLADATVQLLGSAQLKPRNHGLDDQEPAAHAPTGTVLRQVDFGNVDGDANASSGMCMV